MLAPKCATYNGRSTFANPKYLKKAQSDKPRLYEIPYDTSDPANRFCPNGEETVTLEKESRSKLDKEQNHDALCSDSRKDVNARTKKPKVVPIRARIPTVLLKRKNKLGESSGKHLLTDSRGSDLYTISLQETTSSTPICFMAKASPTQAWLWHRRLSHLNFDYITLLSKKDVVTGLPKLKYVRDQLCSSCEMSKAKRSSFKTKAIPSSKGRLNLLHMDLCGPMRVASINGKKYILDW
ncbi:retrovirus-related pol polyprotein from transposon TNT 1-94 [Tanacetum coccineum]|uniref:Retrovirus-related pol polyprotein from transposon TNT 1-94 n=1 Tax=Tanacetum coccineum TaxID=301880 RepID=A0ABQ4Z219_9ASTR